MRTSLIYKVEILKVQIFWKFGIFGSLKVLKVLLPKFELFKRNSLSSKEVIKGEGY
jgi:hypothetical protein